MYIIFVILHLLAALALILVVLLQSGKAGDLASAFGGAGSQTAFGTRSAADFLTRATWATAILFIVTSLGLSILSSRGATSVMEDVPVGQETTAPATPPEATPQSQPQTPPPSGESTGQSTPPQQPSPDAQKPPSGEQNPSPSGQ